MAVVPMRDDQPVATGAAPGQRARRVVVLGPVPPYRGGIAQHTTMMCSALAKQADLLVVSFSELYPEWLYPGESSRDPDAKPVKDFAVRYVIDSLNPMTWRAAVREIRAHAPDLVVIPWWTVFWAPCFWYIARSCRRHGLAVRIFCHHVAEHEPTAWKAALTRAVLRQASSFAVHMIQDKQILERLYPGRAVVAHPHPIYAQFPEPRGTLLRRAPLELLFYGFVRPYKGLPVLIEAMALLRRGSAFLSVVGEFWSGREEAEQRIRELGIGDWVEIVPRYVSDEDTAEYFARADAVVLPYKSVAGSGVIAVAYRYEKPVIVTRVQGFPEVVIDGETGLIVPPGDAPALAAAIDAMSAERAAAMAPAIERLKRHMSWEKLAACVIGAP